MTHEYEGEIGKSELASRIVPTTDLCRELMGSLGRLEQQLTTGELTASDTGVLFKAMFMELPDPLGHDINLYDVYTSVAEIKQKFPELPVKLEVDYHNISDGLHEGFRERLAEINRTHGTEHPLLVDVTRPSAIPGPFVRLFRDHSKAIVIGSEVFLTGSNLDRSLGTAGIFDFALQLYSPPLAELLTSAVAAEAGNKILPFEQLAPSATVQDCQLYIDSPGWHPEALSDALLAELGSEADIARFTLVSQFAPGGKLGRYLEGIVKNGGAVQVVTNNPQQASPLVKYSTQAMRLTGNQLTAKDNLTFNYPQDLNGDYHTIHAKVILAHYHDGTSMAILGSDNFDPITNGLRLRELVAVFRKPSIVSQIGEYLQSVLP